MTITGQPYIIKYQIADIGIFVLVFIILVIYFTPIIVGNLYDYDQYWCKYSKINKFTTVCNTPVQNFVGVLGLSIFGGFMAAMLLEYTLTSII